MNKHLIFRLKKILAITLSLFLCFSSNAITVFAEGDTSLATTSVEDLNNDEESEETVDDVIDADTIYSFDAIDNITTQYKLGLERLKEDFPTSIYAYYGESTKATEISVEWECQDDYDENLGQYVFVPTGLDDLKLAEGVELPSFTVYVEDESEGPDDGYIAPTDFFEIPSYGDTEANSNVAILRDRLLPSYYNQYKNGNLPTVRNQGSEGACWAFGTLGAIESSLILNNGISKDEIDLSERQLAYFTSFGYGDLKGRYVSDGSTTKFVGWKDDDTISYNDGSSGSKYLSNGGNASVAVMFLANMLGPVEEQYAPYSDKTTAIDEIYALSSDYVQLKNVYAISVEDTDAIKQAIIDYGGVTAAFYSKTGSPTYNGNSCTVAYSAENNSFYGTYPGQNHQVMIVGWDDSFKKEDFSENCQPSSDGAWLVRNSWGLDDYGLNGYFWLSYDDVSFNNSNAVYAFEATTDLNDHCYSYDGQPISSIYSSTSDTTISQTFTVDAGESLKAVGFYLYSAGNEVDITVTAGNQSTTGTVTTTNAGYYLVNLEDEILIPETTTVKVELAIATGTDGTVYFPYEYTGIKKYNYIKYTGTCSSGGMEINGETQTFDSRIKLFSDDVPMVKEASLLLDSGDIGLKFSFTGLADYADTGAVLSFNGEEQTIEAPSDGQYIYTAYVSAKEMADDIEVKLLDADKNIVPFCNTSALNGVLYYSVEDYLDACYNAENQNQNVKDAVLAIKNYGLYAQNYFEYNVPETLPELEAIDSYSDYSAQTAGTLPEGVTYVGSSLLLEHSVTIRHYFKFEEDISDFTLTLDGTTLEDTGIINNGSLYYVDVSDISPKNFDTGHVLTVTSSVEETTFSLTYSVLSYCAAVQSAEDKDSLKNLADSIYWFWNKINIYASSET